MNKEHIWLPYTQMKNHLPQLEVESAKGCEIYLKDGRVLIDGISSWWSVAHGYSHPKIVEAVQKQAEKLSHIMLAGFENEETYRLAHRLCEISQLDWVFFSDSGSTAIEVAMKMAWQYFINIGQKNRTKFISFKNSYHGDTTGAMSLADLDSGMHKKFKPLLLENYSLELPTDQEGLNRFEDFVREKKDELAAVFIEPMVQCAGGMKFYDSEILKGIYEVAKRYGVLFVADECAVGFYRLGKRFGCDFGGLLPDIMTLGKALTGGMMTMAATLCSHEIYQGFLESDREIGLDRALMHGPTFMGNPLAAAAGNASLDLFEEGDYESKVYEIERVMKDGLFRVKGCEGVKDVRVLGGIGVVETEFGFEEMLRFRQRFVEMGVFLRPFSGVVYLMPALVIEEGQLEVLVDGVCGVLGD